MYFIFNPATIEALARLVQVLDQHRFGAVMLVVMMVAAGALMAIPYLRLARSGQATPHSRC
jgi:hypothetical protein